MKVDEIRSLLSNNGVAYGTLITAPSPHWVKPLSGIGMDFVFLDTEHVSLGPDMLGWMCQAYGAAGIAPIVRVTSPDPAFVSRAIDAGAAGIVAPYIETPEQVRALSGAVKWKPLKGERLEKLLAGEERPEPGLRTYLDSRSKDLLLLPNIESVPALGRLDDILEVPGLDGIILGPHDLSCSLGIPEEYGDPLFKKAVKTLFSKARGKGLIAGAHFMRCGETALAAEWVRFGCNFLIMHGDIVYTVDGLARDLAKLRGASKGYGVSIAV